MERSLFSFIWKYSRREQIGLLIFTLITFPFLYATLELPKRIINDAIGAEVSVVSIYGYDIGQVQFLFALCFAYLASVIVHGLLKMRLNTMKGVLAERLLRRFRYTLISRMMRFPRSYFQNTSQGELVSMVTSEAEPMGGLMGDAVAQPVFQAGQMIIIVVFLFLQSVWFGLAGVALIPLQAWVIPKLQRQINLLNKERIVEVRQFAAEIGETAAGINDLRVNGGWRYRLATFTDRLGRLFDVRFRIYQKKFFMKFLNNFITQLTPFFFYAAGGYLAIRGEITVGALVAALAAYKDLSSPWKELLAYYNQTQDMSLRWEIVTERFGPDGMIDEALFEGTPDTIPHLRGDVELNNVSVRDADGNFVLENLTLRIPQGSQVAFEVGTQRERIALGELLTREIMPQRGTIRMAGHDLAQLHQSVIAARIGCAHAQPYLFRGNVGDNLLMPLRTSPKTVMWDPDRKDRRAIEARKSGNSLDSTRVDWLDPGLAELNTTEDIHQFWFEITTALGTADLIFDQMLNSSMDQEKHEELAQQIIRLRPKIEQRLAEKGLGKAYYHFDPEAFNPTIPLGGNLIFASPKHEISHHSLVSEKGFLGMIIDQGLAEQGIAISQTLVETLHQTFGMDGTGHPLFVELGIEEALYENLVDIAGRRRDKGDEALSHEEFALLLTVPFTFTAEQIGPSFPESFKEEILRIRKERGAALREEASDLFVPIQPENYLPRLTILENLIYGRMSAMAGMQADLVQDVVTEVIEEEGLKRLVSVTLFDTPTTIGGANLPSAFQERAAFGRAAIKRPDVLVFSQLLTHFDTEALARARSRMGKLLPDTTQIFINDQFADPENFDFHFVIKDGRLGGMECSDFGDDGDSSADDLHRKLHILSDTELFANLDLRSRRLLAFAAQWYEAEEGTRIFAAGDRPDAVYLCLKGKAELALAGEDGKLRHIDYVEPGRLIGDLAVILDQPRQIDLLANEHVRFLRIGAEQFRSVIENDTAVLLSLLRTVGGHLSGAAEVLLAAGVEIPRDFGPKPPALPDDDGT